MEVDAFGVSLELLEGARVELRDADEDPARRAESDVRDRDLTAAAGERDSAFFGCGAADSGGRDFACEDRLEARRGDREERLRRRRRRWRGLACARPRGGAFRLVGDVRLARRALQAADSGRARAAMLDRLERSLIHSQTRQPRSAMKIAR